MNLNKSKIQTSKKIKVGLIYGGQSFEHDVSKMTANSIRKNIDRNLFEIIDIYINKNGNFDKTILENIDIAFLAVHGPNCEDGKLQKILEKRNIKYTGSKIKASQINMNKAKMHSIFRKANLPTIDFLAVTKKYNLTDINDKIIQSFGYPCFIKPNNTGSSFGISSAKNIKELKNSLSEAFKYDTKAIIEQAVNRPREIEIAILGNSKLVISEPGEILTNGQFFSYELKYLHNIVNPIADDLTIEQIKKIKRIAEKAYKATDCSGYARIDFFIDQNEKILINEINTLPGCTEISIFPKMMEAKGISFKELITRIIKLAI